MKYITIKAAKYIFSQCKKAKVSQMLFLMKVSSTLQTLSITEDIGGVHFCPLHSI